MIAVGLAFWRAADRAERMRVPVIVVAAVAALVVLYLILGVFLEPFDSPGRERSSPSRSTRRDVERGHGAAVRGGASMGPPDRPRSRRR